MNKLWISITYIVSFIKLKLLEQEYQECQHKSRSVTASFSNLFSEALLTKSHSSSVLERLGKGTVSVTFNTLKGKKSSLIKWWKKITNYCSMFQRKHIRVLINIKDKRQCKLCGAYLGKNCHYSWQKTSHIMQSFPDFKTNSTKTHPSLFCCLCSTGSAPR